MDADEIETSFYSGGQSIPNKVYDDLQMFKKSLGNSL